MELHQQITSPRTQWKQYKVLKSTRQENEAVAPLQKDGKRKRDIKNADILNDQLKSVFTLDNENNSSAMERPKYPSIGNLSTNNKEVEKRLQKLKINKASGPDDIPPYILRETVTELVPVLSAIFNQPLNIGT